MKLKDEAIPLPVKRWLQVLRWQTLRSSASYWESNYARGLTSGPGSYGALGEAKAAFLNAFVREHAVRSVVEFGCGDGHQLAMAEYPRYIGLDVSPTAIGHCKRLFASDPAKSFFRYDGNCFIDRAGVFAADLVISLDVIYHLVEDSVFESYMTHLFSTSQTFVIIYSTNGIIPDTPPSIRHRHFTPWVDSSFPEWRLMQVTKGTDTGPGRADFFVYERLPTGTVNYPGHLPGDSRAE
jgi:SAM-dependent methyltransferase